MALPRIVLIDDNKQRIQEFEIILSFLEYRVSSVSSDEYQFSSNNLDDVRAIFIGDGSDKQATLIKEVVDKISNLPIVLLVEKNNGVQVSSVIEKMLTQTQEWPCHYSVFNEMLTKLPIPEKVQTTKKTTADKGLAGNSQSIGQVRELIDQVANSEATVLVLGESGTGKEVVAQALHRASNRKNKPFVPVNCGAIPGELLESELFGHEKGAFTGALTARQGRFEMAEGGTLFLDEIGDMPMPMQVKLLRVLQERTFERVGSNKTIECNVRIVAATHRNLETEIEGKRFREDLFYRLNVFPIELPSLRDRVEDIPLLTSDLTSKMEIAKRDTVQFTRQALGLMMQHPWPGNVRELSNFIERLAITHPNGVIDGVDLPEKFQGYVIPDDLDITVLEVMEAVPEKRPDIQIEEETKQGVTSENVVEDNVTLSDSLLPEQGMDLKEYLSELEVNLIQQALKECGGVVAHAAKLLNMRRTTLVEKLRKYEIST